MSKDAWRKLTSAVGDAPLVISGRYSDVLLEVIRQMTLIDEARHRSHVRRDRAVCEEPAGPLHAHLDQILVWG